MNGGADNSYQMQMLEVAGIKQFQEASMLVVGENRNITRYDGIGLLNSDRMLQMQGVDGAPGLQGGQTMADIFDTWAARHDPSWAYPTSLLFLPHPFALLLTQHCHQQLPWSAISMSFSRCLDRTVVSSNTSCRSGSGGRIWPLLLQWSTHKNHQSWK